ncbi:GNAT family N-acetyltransferase [Roseibium sp. HPY-6]|uniref:GNAT family N-acetyltransferase n=1 Tax=Roseibium sp. HPY-6 TaxID=3229852 RepID=UPI00339018B4
MQDELTKTLDSYLLSLSEMNHGDISKLHELSICVNWPHRANDWAMLFGLGEGFVTRDKIGRVLGSAMWFPMGETLASIGMVITSPRLQDHGAGRWLMQHILERTTHRNKILNATKAAYRLYISLDFVPQKTVYQHNGIVKSVPVTPEHSRPLEQSDLPAIIELDEQAYGANRSPVLEKIAAVSEGTVLEQAGEIVGFALRRRFGRGHVIGPVVASSEEDAVKLIQPHVAALHGQFTRVDTRADDGPLRQFLSNSGIGLFDTVTTMTLGEPPKPGPLTTFGLVNQALG